MDHLRFSLRYMHSSVSLTLLLVSNLNIQSESYIRSTLQIIKNLLELFLRKLYSQLPVYRRPLSLRGDVCTQAILAALHFSAVAWGGAGGPGP